MRKLSDEDLDSGDDEGRTDRVANEGAVQYEEEEEQQTFNFMDADIARHPIPEPSDGELYLLKVPQFLAIDPTAFSHKTFQAPTTDHHSKGPASEHFSAYNTAMTTIRWRRSPSDPSQLQSNARILRWSDGSLTLQLASDPLNQYDINGKMLAPPQINPKTPTPTSLKQKPKGAEYKEGYSYLVAPYEEANVMRFTNKFTTGLSVVPTATTKDTALETLQSAMAAAANHGRDEKGQAISFITVEEDPEITRVREEIKFKESQRKARMQEKSAMKAAERAAGRNRTERRAGFGLGGGDLGDGSGRRGAGKSRMYRGYSSGEEDMRPGRTREDEYDEYDDFIAPSDQEPEEYDEDDLDDGIEEAPRRNRGNESPKRKSGGHDEDDDDEEVVISRTKRRRVIEEDDEDE
jgi:RNA polymerase-associated protein LEO1